MAALSPRPSMVPRAREKVTGDHQDGDTVPFLGPTPIKGSPSASSGNSLLTNGQEKEAWVLGAITPSRKQLTHFDRHLLEMSLAGGGRVGCWLGTVCALFKS